MKKNLTILIINWRALKGKDPLAGGAEVATFEHAKRWVSKHAARVIWLCPPPTNNSKSEIIDGVEFDYIGVRLNRNNYTLGFKYLLFCFLVFLKYIFYYRTVIDVVIDEAHGLPYLTPFYVKKKKILYIHEVAGNIWKEMYPFPISFFGVLFESIFFRPYKNITTVTGVESTKSDLVRVGIDPKNIHTINYGLTIPLITKKVEKEKNFTIMYLNRVVKMKRVELALDIFSKVLKKIPNANFWIVGRGEDSYIKYLIDYCKELGIENQVKFWGFIDEDTKIKLFSRAHVFINPSIKEGWGLVNIEANSQGTPVVAFDVPGSRESVLNKVSGYVVPEGDIDQMIDKIISFKNHEDEWYTSCVNYSKKFDWDYLSGKFYKLFL